MESAISSRETSEARMPGGAHRDAVGDGDGIELHRRAARGTDALLDLAGEDAVVEVAGHRLDPGVRDADDGLGEILGAVADAVQVGARGSALGTLGEGAAAVLDIEGGGAHEARTLPAAAARERDARDRALSLPAREAREIRRSRRVAIWRPGRCMLAPAISPCSSAVSASHLASTSSESGRRG